MSPDEGPVVEDEGVSGAEEVDSNVGVPEISQAAVRASDYESDGEEDCGPKRIVPDPGAPTQSEIDDHNVDHLPYRSWCECCVKGKATGEPHRRVAVESKIPIIAFDYMFILKDKIAMKQDLTDEEMENVQVKVLVVKDTLSRSIFAHVVRRKGVEEDGYSVKRLTEDVAWLGYTKVILKSDGERAIVRLLKESLRNIKTEVSGMEQAGFEHPPPYDSRANGSVENACKQLKGQLRTMKLGLEMRLQRRVPEEHPLIAWLVEHAAWLLTARLRGEDGKTPYQRIRGRPCTKKLVEFGERVLYKLPGKGPRAEERATLDARWQHGLTLGFTRHTNQYFIWTGEQVAHGRAVMRLQADKRWDVEALQKVTASVEAMYGCGFGIAERFQEGDTLDPTTAAPEQARAPKSIVVRQADWLAHGGTVGCPKCIHARDNGWGKMGGPHSPACVERFRELYRQTEEGQVRLRTAEARKATWEQKRDISVPAPEEPAAVPFEPYEEEPLEAPRPRGDEQVRDDQMDHEDEVIDADDNDDVMFDVPGGDAMPMTPDEKMGSVEPILSLVAHDAVQQIKAHNIEILKLVNELGGGPRSYCRERAKKINRIVAEIYSPPRVTAAAKLLPSLKLCPGFALDLTTTDDDGRPWDFSDSQCREDCRRLVTEQEPMLIVGSPMCTAFSTWQYLNEHKGDPEKIKRAWNQAMIHMRFACEIYQMQVDAGRYFLHEHPAHATSWQQECVQKIMRQHGVQTVTSDQCQYGQKDMNGHPIRKPTRWMSNAAEVLKTLGRRCAGRRGACSMGGMHATCSGSRAKAAAIYPFVLCKAILQGMRNQLRDDRRLQEGMCGLMSIDELVNLMEDDGVDALESSQVRVTSDYELNAVHSSGAVIKDALTGQPLDPELVRRARRSELDYFESKKVWFKVPRAESYQKMGKAPISVKWVDVNKGDSENPNYRSRLVAREIRKPWEDTIFARPRR